MTKNSEKDKDASLKCSFCGKDQAQIKKLIALFIFVVLLAGSAWFMYNKLVKPSPYYPQEEVDEQ